MLTTLKSAREDIDTTHARMYDKAVQLALTVNVVESLPRTANRQQHRSNTPATTTSEYFKRVITIPSLDHLIAEIDARFHNDSSTVVSQAALILATTVAESQDALTSVDIANLVTMYRNDLPAPDSLDTELHCWNVLWKQKRDEAVNLNTPAKVIKTIDRDFFPNLDILFRIVCTLAVTSAECERSVTRLRCLKTYLRSTMTEARLNGLALLYTHRHIPCCSKKVVEDFAQRNARRMHL